MSRFNNMGITAAPPVLLSHFSPEERDVIIRNESKVGSLNETIGEPEGDGSKAYVNTQARLFYDFS